MLEKRTTIIISSVAILWLVVSFIIIAPKYKQIKKYQGRLDVAGKDLQSLCSENFVLHPEELERLKKQSQQWDQQIGDGAKILGTQPSKNFDTSVVEFRSYWDEQIRRWHQQANKLGITLGDSMGFSQSLPSIIPNHYWTQAELSSHFMSQLLQLAESHHQLYRVVQLDIKNLDKPVPPESFLRPFYIEVVFESSYTYLLELTQILSKPSPQGSFLSISELNLNLGNQPDSVIIKLQLIGYYIQPKGSLSVKIENTQDTNYQTVPLWERY